MIVATRMARDRRRGWTWWAVGILATVLVTAAFWPTIEGSTAFDEAIADLPASLKALIGSQEGIPLSSAPGYLHARLFGTVLPVLFVVFAVGWGARAIGGSEEDGTLELLLAQPVSRASVFRQRALVVVGAAVLLAVVAAVALVAVGAPVGLLDDVDLARLLGACLAAALVGVLHGAVAFAAGAITGRRAPAVAAGAVVAVAGFVAESLLTAAGWVGWYRWLSPWRWYLERNIVAQGLTPIAVIGPLVVALVALAVADRIFAVRDLR